ncbi:MULTISPECIES: hypothetical protein [Streptomyces]|uniref:Excreted virulence factor EspC, type VII ESX diderm n=1 Tax=Streptomyces pini TaxID=1520580 RepID=A0A1I4IXX6_9ACTN|nr:hypothetical protein [Streptomyces pini]SFL58701.1 hypothetical protein SAMN05192584_12229 [Streptomyces pini]
MSFDEEWAELVAAAAARRDTARTRLNGVPNEGPGPSGAPGDGFSVSAQSIDGSSHLLVEIAGLLHAGRMDGENATMCRVPRAHPEVASKVTTFARYSQELYGDMVTLLAALSSRLKSAGDDYTAYDADVQQQMDTILASGRFVAAEDR